MKTLTLSIAFISCFLTGVSQNEPVSVHINNYNEATRQFYSLNNLQPVYFNFRARKLKDSNHHVINAIVFLHLCRSIKDSAIQLQVARYDAFTKDKERLGVIALSGGFSAIALLGSAGASTASQGYEAFTAPLVCLGVIGILAIPAAAIYSTVPHQKRKAVLFRDLPVAYNQYVESLNFANTN